jgi:hypothetical protein
MGAKQGNDRERQRQRIEDRIIRRIDANPGGAGWWVHHGPLRLCILDLLCYRARVTGLPAIRSLNAVPASR